MKYIILLLSFLFFSATTFATDNVKSAKDKKTVNTTINTQAAKNAKTFDPINSDTNIDSADRDVGCGGKLKPDRSELPLGCNNADVSCVCNADTCDWVVSCN